MEEKKKPKTKPNRTDEIFIPVVTALNWYVEGFKSQVQCILIILQSRMVPAGDKERDPCEEVASLVHKHAAQMLMTDT